MNTLNIVLKRPQRERFRNWQARLPAILAGIVVMGPWLPGSSALAQEQDPNTLKLSYGLTISTELKPRPSAVLPVTLPQLSAIPERVPPGPRDYRIGADDLIDIQVFGVDQLSRTVRVNSRGQVSLPLVGTLDMSGLTAQEAEVLVANKLRESYMQDPQVSLFIKEYTSQRITIEGAVVKPGIYPIRGQTSLLQSLALAGGGGSLSDMSEVMIFRNDEQGKRTSKNYDIDRIRSGELDDPPVLSEDVIVVKRSARRAALKDSLFRDIIDTINPFR